MSETGEFLALFLSGVGKLLLDPLTIGVGTLIGLAASSWLQRIFLSFLFALIITFAAPAATGLDPALTSWWLVACRTVVVSVWSVIGAAVRWLIARFQAV